MIDRGIIQHKDVTRTAHLGNHWSVGSSLAWFPAFAFADAIRPFTPRFPRNGFSLPYNAAVVVTSALAGLLTILIGYGVTRRLYGAGVGALAAAGGWVATTLMWYALVHATMSHAVSAAACALVFMAAVTLRERSDGSAWLLAGMAAGFAFAVRPQNAPVAAVPLIVAPFRTAAMPWYAAGILVGALPQIIVSWFIYGSAFGFLTGGGSATPFAALQKIWIWEPLFSWYHGLFTWTPFALLGLAGLAVLARSDRRLAAAGLFLFATQWIVNATMERSFWGATSFGQRRFDNCTIVFIIGAAALIATVRPFWRVVMVAVPAAWTLSIFLAARSSILDLSRYVTPGEMLQSQIVAIRSIGAALTPLGATPAAHRPAVAVLLIVIGVVVFLAATALTRLPSRAAAAAGAAYFTAASIFLAWAGTQDARLIPRYAPLIERNRVFAEIPGGADVRFGLLRDEIDYLARSGRTAEAEDTARELAALEAARAAALRAHGLR